VESDRRRRVGSALVTVTSMTGGPVTGGPVTVGSGTGTAVGEAVGTAVGTAVGDPVGTPVGRAVGSGVGAPVADGAGTGVGGVETVPVSGTTPVALLAPEPAPSAAKTRTRSW